MTTTSDAISSPPGSPERHVALARGVLWWERVWPALWPASGIAELYFVAALFGLIDRVPASLHGLVQAFTLACIGLVAYESFRGLRWPGWMEGARRVERDSALAHRPISEGGDHLAAGIGDPAAEALWRLHLTQLLRRIANLRVARPRSALPARDPHAWRYVLLVALAGGVVFAGSDSVRRIEASLVPDSGAGASVAGIDAWIDPPAYTGLPPVYLARSEARIIPVPAGSELEVRVHDASARPHLAVDVGDAPSFTGGHREYGTRYTITASGLVRVRADGRTLGDWRIQAIPDLPPQIAFLEPPSRTPHDAVKFVFSASDDYGVTSVRALIRAVLPAGKTGTTQAVDLPLSASSKTIKETIFRDLTENPFAGLDVTITLEARDSLGQAGLSRPVRFHLPARIFTNPLARALVEQRQILAVNASGAREKVEEMLDALSIAPQIFYKDQNAAYLAQRTIFRALTGAKTPADIARVEDLLWQTALSLDQAGLASAAEELRRIAQLLSQALAQGAPQDQVDALLQRYQQALSRYLQMLAQSAQHGGQQPQGQAMNISPDDLEKLLKAIQQAAASGSRQSAAQMLAMLQSLLENLHMTQGGGGGGQADKALSDAIQGLSDLLGRQRELMDKTYRQSQGAGDPKDGGAKGLAQQQGKLKDDLDKALKGLGAGKKVPDKLGHAGHEMGDAQGELGADSLEGAGQSQKNALDDLRGGIGDLANQLMKEQGGQQGQANADPLGRSQGNGLDPDGNLKVPDQSSLARARGILQELRRRAGEQGRPKRELDYLDRLLKQF
ncbi:MAG TPA: DUF4175 family protein [Rhizomicrobium sp.]|jgi:uncharacterized protein (TIGR02302 family)|nr:DUF4175 family protein [Rhizomicrobium sp.]